MKFTVFVAALLVTVAAALVDAQNAASPVGPNTVPGLAPLPATVPLGTHVGVVIPTGYEDGGRRDPFSALVAPKKVSSSGAARTSRPEMGLAGLALADATIRGLTKKDNTWQALIEGANKRSYVVHPKDKLLDATVVSIDEQGVVFAEQVDAGMPLQKVRRQLHSSGEEAR